MTPSHIFIGTQIDNMQDCAKKGRNKLIKNPIKGDNHWMKKPENVKRVKKMMSDKRKKEFSSGRRQVIRGEGGRLLGTRMA